MNAKILTLILSLLILSTAVSAELVINKYTNDFVASSPNNEQLKLCSCETKVDKIIVENIGTFYGDFHVDVRGDYPAGIRIVKQDFQLAPKHFQEVLIYIENSCGLRGTFEYDVVVTNSYGRTQVIHRTIRVDRCDSASLEVTPFSRTVGLCQPAVFNVTMANTGTFADTFSLGFGGYQPDAAARDVYLQPGESYSQDVTFEFPCTTYGKRTIPFTLITEKNGPAETLWRDITITNDYGYGLNVSSRIDVCARTTTEVPIIVENTADVPDDVRIELDAPRFVTLASDVHLNASESKNITLTIAPEEPGVHTISIRSSDRFGGITRDRDIELHVNNCYDPAVDMRLTPETVMSGPDSACCGEKTYYVNIRNNGDRAQTFQVSIDGPSFFVLEETTVRLEPDQNINVPINAELPCSDELYSAVVRVSPLGQPQVNVSAQLAVNSATERTCHMVQIDDDELDVKDTATIVPVIVKHTGIEGGEYDITVNSTLFEIQEESITLLPGDQRAIHLVPITNLTEEEKGRYIVQPSFTLREQELVYNEHVGIDLEGKGFFERLMDWLYGLPWNSITLCVIVVFLLLLLIIVAAIILGMIYAGRPVFASGLKPSTLFWLKTVLIVAIVLLLIAMLFLEAPGAEIQYERVAQTTESLTIEMYQNTEKMIDVKQYFTDPDMDILSYTVTQPRDISATIEGSTLNLRPDMNFAGQNTMVITASDSKGGIADSPVFIINVIPRRQLGFLQWVQMWCHYLVVGGLILLLLLLLLIVLTIPEYRPKPYSGNTLIVIDKGKAAAARRRSGRVVRKKKAVRKTRTAAASKAAAKRRATRKRGARTAARTAARGSRALVPVRGVTVARGRQVTPARRETLVREFKGSGQTVNIAVGAQPHPAPAVLAVPGYQQSEIIYVGSKEGNTVHTPYCINARRIPKNKRVAYSTKREAVSAGLVPCKMCRPFEGGI